MNLKTQAIGCVKFKVKHYWCKDFEEQIEVGIVTNSYTKNNEPYIEFYTTMGNTINIPLKNISSFTSTRISEELRELLKEYYKEYCSYTKEREKLLLLEKELNKKNQYLKQYSSKLLVAQGILTPNEFINALTEKLNLTNSDWAVDFNPGCCILYEDNN